MAAPSIFSAIDLKVQATFPLRLGASVLKQTGAKQFSTIRYNYKPSLKRSDPVQATISEEADAGESRLSFEDERGSYSYSGSRVEDTKLYVVTVKRQGKDKVCVLERVDSTHGFNLISTPTDSDAAKLAERYPHLPDAAAAAGGDGDDLFGENDEDSPADESNPFDYRHFLKTEQDRPESTNASQDLPRSSAPSRTAQNLRQPAASKPSRQPAETKAQPLAKRKTVASEKPNPKRVKAGQETPAAPAAEPTKPKPEVPKINVDRRASLRRSSVEDSGELIVEDETPQTEKPRKNIAMSLALSGHLGSGPVSLNSTTNSPHSRVTSPGSKRADDIEEEYVFEFDEEPGSQAEQTEHEDEDEEEGDDDADADADVDALALPSPTQDHGSNPSGFAATGAAAAAAGEDEDDLEGLLAEAMKEGDDAVSASAPAAADQESEESEEE